MDSVLRSVRRGRLKPSATFGRLHKHIGEADNGQAKKGYSLVLFGINAFALAGVACSGRTGTLDDEGLFCTSRSSPAGSVLPTIGREEAIVAAYNEFGEFPVKDAHLEYWSGAFSRDGTPVVCPLAWVVSSEQQGLVTRIVYVDATTEDLLSASERRGSIQTPG
jgi:hypothetical protein